VALLEKRRYLNNRSGDFPQVILIVPSHVPNTLHDLLLHFLFCLIKARNPVVVLSCLLSLVLVWIQNYLFWFWSDSGNVPVSFPVPEPNPDLDPDHI
jgi:hypothetical protein